ncbi:asparagine synthase-related protein [Falsihalocynthiibacter sp. BN13B15]|uniref:asparagine synthase-related protein n=1 Tax=Falsihalocynthiibacter sp. BN13B15 TaxID=3240871 RepID=UPI00350FF0D7
MSGIAGIVRFDGGPVELGHLERMTNAMAYRGPDGITHWSSEHAALGHCMLQTTNESLEESQPLANEDAGLNLVMDGRLDNWEELRCLLLAEGARLRTRSDAELVLRAYERWGEACLEKIDGDFALAIWDARQHKLFCARDRAGAKPFVYHWDGHCLIFASEIHAVLAGPNVPRELNQGALAEHLSAELTSRDDTLWQGVSRLIAARSMTVDEYGPRIKSYWNPKQIPLIHFHNDADYVEHYQEVLFETVRRQSRSHRPVGYEVSGGLDSSAMFSVGNKLHREGRLHAPDIAGFTLKFEKDTDAFELDFAHAVGAHCGRSIVEVRPTHKSVEWLRCEAARLCTVPNFPNTLMHRGIFETHHQNGGRVVVNGTGGDQWLAFGENDLAECMQIGAWKVLRKSLQADFSKSGAMWTMFNFVRHGVYPNLPSNVRKAARWALQREESHTRRSHPWLSAPMQELLDERMRQNYKMLAEKQSGIRIGLRERLMSLEGGFPTFARETMERMGSLAGIEYRSPFYSHAFLNMALGLPLTQLRNAQQDRSIHRKAMVGLLPEAVRQRTSKAEFSTASTPYREGLAALRFPTTLPGKRWLRLDGFSQLQNEVSDLETEGLYWSVGILTSVASCCEIVNNRTTKTNKLSDR